MSCRAAGESRRDRKPEETPALPQPPPPVSASQGSREDGDPRTGTPGRGPRKRVPGPAGAGAGAQACSSLSEFARLVVKVVVPQGPTRGGRGSGGDPIQPPVL